MYLKRMRVFFFDLDGVLTVGKEKPRYIGGRDVVAKIRSLGAQVAILTNDSTHTRKEIRDNLHELGLSFNLDEILTSSYVTADYLTERFGKARFYLIGEEGLRRELEAAGHRESQDDPDVVVVGFDRELNYWKLDQALRKLRDDAVLVGSYGGAVYMSDKGPALSAGPIIKALEYGSGKKAVMIGKPSPMIFRLALRRMNEKPQNAVMVGDQLETDVLGAQRARVHTIIVLTGVENTETIRRSKLKPEMVIDNVDLLMKYL